MSAIYRVGQRFGAMYIIAVLRGSQNQKIKEYQHDKLSVFGIGKDRSREYWQSVIRQLIHLGLIKQVIDHFNITLQLTLEALPILRGEQPLKLATPRISSITNAVTIPKRAVTNYDKDLFARLRFCVKK